MFGEFSKRNKSYQKLALVLLDLILLFLVSIINNFLLQDILFILFLYIFLYLISPKEIKNVIIIAFVLRIVFVLLDIYVFPLPKSGPGSDAVMFEGIAFELSKNGLPWLLSHFTSGSFMYSWIIAVIYVFVGRNTFIIQGLNSLLGALVVLNVYLISREIWTKKESYFASFCTVFFPTLIYFSALAFREMFIVWSFTFGVYFTVLWLKVNKLQYFVIGILLFIFSLGFHTAMLYLPFVLIVPVSVSIFQVLRTYNQKIKNFLKHLLEFLIIGISLIFVYKTKWGLEKVDGIISSLSSPSYPNEIIKNPIARFLNTIIQYISQEQKVAARDRAAYLTNLQVKSFLDIFWQTPIRILYFLFSPFLWQLKNLYDLIGFFDALIYIIMFVIIALEIKKISKNKLSLLVLFLAVCGTIVFALTTSNYGTALRHRAKFAPLFIVLVAPYITELYKKFVEYFYKRKRKYEST